MTLTKSTRVVEQRIFGLNACLAVFKQRPYSIRKVFLQENRLQDCREILAWLANKQIGYRIVTSVDLEKLTQTKHHEGVCFDVLRAKPISLLDFYPQIKNIQKNSLLVWLDGVTNPHNFGAILRSAAHFSVDAILLPPKSLLTLSGATCRVAEGGAEFVPIIHLEDTLRALQQLIDLHYTPLLTVVADGTNLYQTQLPKRSLLILGQEQGGVSAVLKKMVQKRLQIPGSAAVESLNVATAFGIMVAEYWRQHKI